MLRRSAVASSLVIAALLGLAASVRGQQPAAEAQPESTSATSPTVEEILARHVTARGGLDRIKALDDLRITGTLATAQGMTLPVVILRKRPNLYRLEITAQGGTVVQAYDGANAWSMSPMANGGKARPLEEAQARQVAVQADFDGLLVEPSRKGHKVALVGREPLGDGEVYRLEITLEGGGTRASLVGVDDFLEKKEFAEVPMQGSMVQAEIQFDDYRPVQGVLFPFRQATLAPMGEFALTVETVEAGSDIDREIFFMPGQEADPELTLEQILERHRAARLPPGSAAVQTVKATGKVVFQGFELPMRMQFQRPSSFRVDIDLQGLEMIQAYDGEVAWQVSPMQGITEPEALPAEATGAVSTFSDFVWGLLTGAAVNGADIDLVGVDKVERDETYHLAVSLGDGQRDVYLGGEDFLERQVSFDTTFMGQTGALDARLSNYETISGLVVPRLIQLLINGNPQGEMRIETVEVGAEIDPTLFSMPPKPTQPAESEGSSEAAQGEPR